MAQICLFTLIITVISFTHGQHSHDESYPQALVFCKTEVKNEIRLKTSRKTHQRSLLFISTLDGKVTALDTESGHYMWSVMTGPGGLLSSSLTNLELPRTGRWTRLVPTLEGNLYRFNGEGFEALPISADTLLSSSLKVADDVIITGGKDNRGYGIDYKTGKLKYICSMDGCKFFGNDVVNQDNVLVVRRFTNVIRAADPKTGLEKWNYSVSHLDLHFLESESDIICESNKDLDENEAFSNENRIDGNPDINESNIRIVIPSGLVMKFASDAQKTVLWQHRFDSPIANAWMMQNGEVKKVNLMENFQQTSKELISKEDGPEAAVIYFGIHQQQYYIQQSPQMQQKVSDAILKYSLEGQALFPRIHWKPYMHTAISRTPLVVGNHMPEDESFLKLPERSENTALMIRRDSDYPYDGGYYILPEETPLDLGLIFPNTTDNGQNDSVEQIIIVSLWYWWREIIGIAVLTLVINFAFTMYYWKKMKLGKREPFIVEVEKKTDSKFLLEHQLEFTSKYYAAFEPIRCLGKGGFGIVFQARKKFDGCEYAIKRIPLPNRPNAREKVMREVTALAKLDHIGIVRYFDAWFESPPPGWQEDMDKYWEESSIMSSNVVSTDCSVEQPKMANESIKDSENTLEDVLLCDKDNNNSASLDTGVSCIKREESGGSFGFDQKESAKFHDNIFSLSSVSSFESGDSLEAPSKECLTLPFQSYNINSALTQEFGDARSKEIDSQGDSFIVFEDSGCGDKSGNGGKFYPFGADSSRNHWDEKTESKIYDRRDIDDVKNLQLSKGFDCSPANGFTISRVYLHIQMQLCRKDNLKDWLNSHSESRDKFQVLDFFHQIVSAVEYVHDQGLMHRDLKPSNIFFSMDGTIKVGDFGLVTAMTEETDDHTPFDDTPFKKHTNQVGTQLYMSPEQIMGLNYNHKVDIFSLGLIFFELLIPFTTQMERLKVMVGVKQRAFPDRFEEKYSEEGLFINEMLSLDPESRPNAVDIKQHSLLQAFLPRPELLQHRRSRNISQSFSTSSSGSLDLTNEF